jgi:hypothetical protein
VPTSEISGTQVQDMRAQLERYHGGKRANQEYDDLFYEQNSEALAREWLPADIPIYKSALSTDVVDQVSDQLRTDEPSVIYGALTNSDREMERKSRLEGWGKQIILDDQEGQDIDAYSQAGKDLALRGESVIKRLHNTNLPKEPTLNQFKGRGKRENFREAHQKWEAEMATTSPLLPARAIDPLNIFIPPNAVNPLPYIIEHQRRRQTDIWDDYPDWQSKLAAKVWMEDGKEMTVSSDELNDPLREVDWLEYWSKTRYIVIVDGIELFDKKNPYGFVPYRHRYSGMGRTNRDSSSAAKAASILSKIRGELLSEIILKTIMFELSQGYVFPRIRVPEGREEIIRGEMGHRGILTYDPNDPKGPDSIKWLDPIPINSAVSGFLAEAQNAIARRVNPILSGQGQQDSEFGVLEALRIGQATKGIQEITTNLNRLATGIIRQAAQMVIALDLKMTVTATVENGGKNFTMKSSDLKSYKQMEVHFDAIDALEQTRQQQAGMTLYRGEAITRRTLQTKYLNDVVENVGEEEIQFGVEAASRAFYGSEQFMQWAIQHHTAQLAQQQAQKERDGVRGNLPTRAGRPQAGRPQGDAGAGGRAAAQGSTIEALAAGGATTETREQAQAVTTETI